MIQQMVQEKPQEIAIAIVTIILIWLISSLRQHERNGDHINPDEVVHQLLYREKTLLTQSLDSISSLTWFRGDLHKAKTYLRDRLAKILTVNPWLAGRLATRNGEITMVFPSNEKKILQQLDTIFCYQQIPISRNTPYEEILSSIHSLLVKRGEEALDQDQPVFRVSILPDINQPTDRFVLVTSLSHTVGDGHTFYILHKMLSKDRPIRALSIERKHEMFERGKAILRNGTLARDIGFQIMKRVTSQLCLKLFWINESWIQEQKKKNCEKRDGELFISTNDIITSNFFECVGCEKGLMSVNFRDKNLGIFESDAGNYFGVLAFSPEEYLSPSKIRIAVNRLKRGEPKEASNTPISPLELLFGRKQFGIATNWGSFYAPIAIEECTQELHFPVFPKNLTESSMSSISRLTIFKTDVTNKVAALFIGDPTVWNNMEKGKMVGKPFL